MTLLPEVNTLQFLQYNRPPHVYNHVPNVWKASFTISASTAVYIQRRLPYSKKHLLSCVVTSPSQWFFHFGEEFITARTHIGWLWWMFQYLPSPAMKEILDVSRMSPCTVMKDDGYWNIRRTLPCETALPLLFIQPLYVNFNVSSTYNCRTRVTRAV
jgi:hypothetical protein